MWMDLRADKVRNAFKNVVDLKLVFARTIGVAFLAPSLLAVNSLVCYTYN